MNVFQRKLFYFSFFLFFATPFLSSQDLSDIKMNADKVDFDYETGMSNFKGNVDFQYRDVTLKADEAKISLNDKKGQAEGNVMILDGSRVFFCDKVKYDFQNKTGIMVNGTAIENVWVLKGERVTQLSKDLVEVENARISICNNSNPHYSMTAKKVHLVPGKEFIGKNVVFWMGPIPVFYWPYYKRQIDGNGVFGLRLRHNDIFGLQVLTHYNFYSGDNFKSRLLLDWYQKKGVGVGLDNKLLYPNGEGKLFTYYIKDEEFEPIRSTEPAGEMDRYRLSLYHSYQFPNNWDSKLNLNVHSDIDIYDDYFSNEFDHDIQTDNRYKLSLVTEHMATSLSLRFRLNDFYNVLERLPQAQLDIFSKRIGDSNFYVSSINQAVYLREKLTDNREGNEAVRFFSGNSLSFTDKYFGWLTISPEINGELSWYSKTPNKDPLDKGEGDSTFRFSGSFSSSFTTNMYKIYQTGSPIFGYQTFRHALTPSLKFSYRPEPSKTDEEIYQFDEIDNVGEEENIVGIELLSRWQGKKEFNPVTLLDTRYLLFYDLTREDDPWENFVWDSEVRLSENVKMDFEFSYDINESEAEYFRTDFSWRQSPFFGLSFTYWYRPDEDNIFQPEVSVNLGNNLFFRAYAFYNEGTETFERKEFSLVKSLHCMDLALLYSEREFREEQTIYLSLSPKGIVTRGVQFGNDVFSQIGVKS